MIKINLLHLEESKKKIMVMIAYPGHDECLDSVKQS